MKWIGRKSNNICYCLRMEATSAIAWPYFHRMHRSHPLGKPLLNWWEIEWLNAFMLISVFPVSLVATKIAKFLRCINSGSPGCHQKYNYGSDVDAYREYILHTFKTAVFPSGNKILELEARSWQSLLWTSRHCRLDAPNLSKMRLFTRRPTKNPLHRCLSVSTRGSLHLPYGENTTK